MPRTEPAGDAVRQCGITRGSKRQLSWAFRASRVRSGGGHTCFILDILPPRGSARWTSCQPASSQTSKVKLSWTYIDPFPEKVSYPKTPSTRYKFAGASLLNMEPSTAGTMLPPPIRQLSCNGLGLGEHSFDQECSDRPQATSNLLKKSESAARTGVK